MKDRLIETPGALVTSSYSAASSSCKWCFGISLGRICWLMLIKKKKRQGEQDSSYRNPCYTKKTREYTNWKIVNVAMYKMVLTLQRKHELLPRPCLESSVSAIGIWNIVGTWQPIIMLLCDKKLSVISSQNESLGPWDIGFCQQWKRGY